MTANMILLTALLLVALWTVMTTRLILSVVGLAITSVILSIVMFRLDAPLAAVFELSVCAGLIFVIFITTVSFTHRVSKEMYLARKMERLVKFWYLPIIIVIAGLVLLQLKVRLDFPLPVPLVETDARSVLWKLRHLDILGQIIVLLSGAFGVVVLFKDGKK